MANDKLSIERYKEVVANNPIQQTWQLLHLFHVPDYVEARITQQIGEKEAKQFAADVKKQAQQISYTLRQAEEYFHAATQVSIATKPLLLYYGAVCLARALILFRGSGKMSFDYQRKHSLHKHHGLLLVGDKDGSINQSALNLLSMNSCSVHFRDDTGEAWGAFGLFYNSLIPPAARLSVDYAYDTITTTKFTRLFNTHAFLPKLETFRNAKMSLWNLLLFCPDMEDTIHYFVPYAATPYAHFRLEETAKINSVTQKVAIQTHIFIKGVLGVNDIETLKQSGLIPLHLGDRVYHFEKRVEIPLEGNEEIREREDDWWLVDDLNGENYLHVSSDFWQPYVPEPAALYIEVFCLGWLVRYYPDIWLTAINDVTLSELVEKYAEIFSRKFPLLILDQMTLIKHHIHS